LAAGLLKTLLRAGPTEDRVRVRERTPSPVSRHVSTRALGVPVPDIRSKTTRGTRYNVIFACREDDGPCPRAVPGASAEAHIPLLRLKAPKLCRPYNKVNKFRYPFQNTYFKYWIYVDNSSGHPFEWVRLFFFAISCLACFEKIVNRCPLNFNENLQW